MQKHEQRIMVIYPPGQNYMRGEDRCQINVDASACNGPRACNDLGYISAGLKKLGFKVFLKDYQGEKQTSKDLLKDVGEYLPDVIFISTTNGSIYYDLDEVSKIKKKYPAIIFILKGALFFNIEDNIFEEINLTDIDYLIGGESEFIVPNLINSIFFDKEKIKNIEGICYKESGKWIQNKLIHFNENIDELPFPDRSAMNNSLYINPDTNSPIATISVARGCPFECIFCCSPVISGKKIRKRSVSKVLEEIEECYFTYKIDNFFFKSDTFTAEKPWVMDLCDRIIKSDLNGKIKWVATSRTNTIDEEMIIRMKEAGCILIAFGFESGSDDSLSLMKKNTTVEENLNASLLCKKHGIKMLGHFLIGLPWEGEKHIMETKKHIFDIDADYIELAIAVPFRHTELFNMMTPEVQGSDDNKDNYLGIKVLGRDSFRNTIWNNKYLSGEKLQKFRKNILKSYYTRPSYIYRKLTSKTLTFGVFLNYVKYGLRLLKNTLF